jgi:hypothetical protein
MQKSVVSVFLFFMINMSLSMAQVSDTMYRFVFEEAQRCAVSSYAKDYKTLRHYTHPNVIAAAGGYEGFLNLLEDTYKSLEDEGLRIDTAYAEQPSSQIVREQGELRCIIPNKVIISMGDTKIISHSNLMGFSFDDGLSWCFVEAEKIKDAPSREAFFPKLKTDLVIPDDRMEMQKK